MIGRVKIVVSDLHVGAGRVEDGNVLEDFTVDEAFATFLQELRDESEAQRVEMELIVAGDMFEYLQVPHVDEFDPALRYPPELYLSSSASDSVRKTRFIIAGHPLVFRALKTFINPVEPRRWVTIIKGNHDVNLHWHSVQQMLREAVGATGSHSHCFVFEERRIRRDGIWVEHGNQYTEKANRFDDFEEPHDPKRVGQLVLPLGSRFVINFFNDVERERYWVDGVKPITALIWYMFALDFPFAVHALSALLREIPAFVRGNLSREARSVAGLDALNIITHDLSRVGSLARRFREDNAFRQRFLAWVERCLTQVGLLEEGELSVDSTATALQRATHAQIVVGRALEDVAVAKEVEENVRVVIFGHTHSPTIRPLPRGGVYINTGTWTWRRDFTGETLETWRRFYEHPERYVVDRDLTYARIDYDGDEPVAKLLRYERRAPAVGVGAEILSWWWRMLRCLRRRLSIGKGNSK